MMLPIRGEISIAPIITAVEFMFRPMEAIRMARISTHMLVPLTAALSTSRIRISSWEAVSLLRENASPKSFLIPSFRVIHNKPSSVCRSAQARVSAGLSFSTARRSASMRWSSSALRRAHSASSAAISSVMHRSFL